MGVLGDFYLLTKYHGFASPTSKDDNREVPPMFSDPVAFGIGVCLGLLYRRPLPPRIERGWMQLPRVARGANLANRNIIK